MSGRDLKTFVLRLEINEFCSEDDETETGERIVSDVIAVLQRAYYDMQDVEIMEVV